MDVVRNLIDRHFDGRPAAMARAIGGRVKRQHVEYWVRTGRIPPEHCPTVEKLVHGAVRCEQMHPGLAWQRVPDTAWPGGKPLLDYAASLVQVAA